MATNKWFIVEFTYHQGRGHKNMTAITEVFAQDEETAIALAEGNLQWEGESYEDVEPDVQDSSVTVECYEGLMETEHNVTGWTRWDDLIDMSLIGQTFELDNNSYRFTRFMDRAKSNHVVATRLSDGTTHRFDSVRVARAFGKIYSSGVDGRLKRRQFNGNQDNDGSTERHSRV